MHKAPTFTSRGFVRKRKKGCILTHLQRIGTGHVKTASGYVSENARYRVVRREGCPLRCRCFKAKGNRTIELNHRLRKYRQNAKELLCSEEGLKHRGQSCIEPEAVFEQMKYNMNYKRFRHFGKDKVFMDFAFFAVAFNIKKMCAKMAKEGIDWLIKRFYELTVAIFRCCEHISKYCSLKKGHSLNITKSGN